MLSAGFILQIYKKKILLTKLFATKLLVIKFF